MRALLFVLAFVAVVILPARTLDAQTTIGTPSCQIITSTNVSLTTTPCSLPTAPPTNPPTAPPTPNPGVFQGFVNGQPYPANFLPFPTAAVWSSPLPAITPGYYTTDSATIVAAQWAQNTASFGQAIHNPEPGQLDTSIPVYISLTTDPLINLVNPIGGNNIGTTGGIPAQMYIPALARPTQSIGLPSNLTVFQPSGLELDFNVTTNGTPATLSPSSGNWASGMTMPVANYGALCANFYSGSGVGTGIVSTTQAGQCGASGLVGIADLQRGVVNHALVVYPNCVASGTVFPAIVAQGVQVCTDGIGPKVGYTMWYDVPCSTTRAGGGQLWYKAVLCALNQYGAIVAGSQPFGGTIGAGSGLNGGQFGFSIGFESSEPFYAYGTGDAWAIMFNQGWVGFTTAQYAPGFQRWYARPQDASGNTLSSPTINFATHIHYVNACVKQQTC